MTDDERGRELVERVARAIFKERTRSDTTPKTWKQVPGSHFLYVLMAKAAIAEMREGEPGIATAANPTAESKEGEPMPMRWLPADEESSRIADKMIADAQAKAGPPRPIRRDDDALEKALDAKRAEVRASLKELEWSTPPAWFKARKAGEERAVEEAKEPWETPSRWAKALFEADGVIGRIEMTLEGWLGFSNDPERMVWAWHDSYDASLEVCISGAAADWHVPDARVDEIHSWGFDRVWFHYEDGTEQTEKGHRHVPSIVRYKESGTAALLARARKKVEAAESLAKAEREGRESDGVAYRKEIAELREAVEVADAVAKMAAHDRDEALGQERAAWAMLTDPKCMGQQPLSAIAAVAQAANVYLQDYEQAMKAQKVRVLAERAEAAEKERDEARERAAELSAAIARGGLDLSPCRSCSCLVACIPDGLPYCDGCAAAEEKRQQGET